MQNLKRGEVRNIIFLDLITFQSAKNTIKQMKVVSHCKSREKIWTPSAISAIILQIIQGINARRNDLFSTFHIKPFVKVANWSRFVMIMSLSYIGRGEGVTTTVYNFTFSFSTDLRVNTQSI